MKLIHTLQIIGNSRLDKQRILAHALPGEIKVLEYTYHPQYKFHVTRFSRINMEKLGTPSIEMFNLLDSLKSRKLSGDRAKNAVNEFANINGDLIKLICKKNLKCGISAKTINTAIPGLIPVFNVQLAKEVPIQEVDFPCIGQLKYDGVRLIALVNNGHTIFKTRNGNEVNLPILAACLNEYSKTDVYPFILDGEITLSTGKVEDRPKVSGMINSAMHGGSIDEQDLVFNTFDIMLLEDWNAEKCSTEYADRWNGVNYTIGNIDSHHFVKADTWNFNSAEEATVLYNLAISQGYEGLILKHWDHEYSFKRTKDWVKMKEVKEVTLLCTGYELADDTSKYEGQVGALICTGKVEGHDIQVSVGSGLSDGDRAIGDYFINQLIEVKYNSVIQDSVTKQWSLFLPRFVCVREDL